MCKAFCVVENLAGLLFAPTLITNISIHKQSIVSFLLLVNSLHGLFSTTADILHPWEQRPTATKDVNNDEALLCSGIVHSRALPLSKSCRDGHRNDHDHKFSTL